MYINKASYCNNLHMMLGYAVIDNLCKGFTIKLKYSKNYNQ